MGILCKLIPLYLEFLGWVGVVLENFHQVKSSYRLSICLIKSSHRNEVSQNTDQLPGDFFLGLKLRCPSRIKTKQSKIHVLHQSLSLKLLYFVNPKTTLTVDATLFYVSQKKPTKVSKQKTLPIKIWSIIDYKTHPNFRDIKIWKPKQTKHKTKKPNLSLRVDEKIIDDFPIGRNEITISCPPLLTLAV